jgi:hypothetical protein
MIQPKAPVERADHDAESEAMRPSLPDGKQGGLREAGSPYSSAPA